MNGNKKLSGSGGMVWINNEELAEVKSIELKVTGKFESFSQCGDLAEGNTYTGWSGDGTIVMVKEKSRGIALLAEAYKSGIMPDIKVITKLTDFSTGESERCSVEDIVLTEFSLAKFEAQGLCEEEIPLKFSKYDILEMIV